MQKGQSHISATDSEFHSLPLEQVILSLKANGFSIKPDDYIEILKVIEHFQPATLEEAGTLICPLIATTPEEQEKFRLVFASLLTDWVPPKVSYQQHTHIPIKEPPIRKKNREKLFILLASIILILAMLSFALNIPPVWRGNTKSIKARFLIIKLNKSNSSIQTGDSLLFNASASFSERNYDSATDKIEWNLGKGWQYSSSIKKVWVADEPGEKKIMLRITPAKGPPVSDSSYITVCDKLPAVSFQYKKEDILLPGSTIEIKAVPEYGNLPEYNTSWLSGTDTIRKNSAFFYHTFDSAGQYKLTFIIQSKESDESCVRVYPLNFTVQDTSAQHTSFTYIQSGDPVQMPLKINPSAQFAIVTILLLCYLIVTILLLIREPITGQHTAVKMTLYENAKDASHSKQPIYEIPLENRQHQLVSAEPPLNDVMRFLQQRTMDEALTLDIPKTVRNTILTGGIPEIVYHNKLRMNDYLVVIDNGIKGSQQLHLFEYLIRTFKNENISIVRFFFRDNFTLFYNEENPSGISIHRLSQLYHNFTLIVIGNAHHLIYNAYPVIDTERLQELAEWENKGILTPLSFSDWGVNEKLISEHLILLPADIEGQARFVKAINEKLFSHRNYLTAVKSFYPAAKYDFTEAEEVKAYLHDDDLFQWACAIAIYPKIRWEIFIEIGKAVLTSRGCPEKLNYSNLLKLTRITWLYEGYFPEYTRLELLKQLGEPEEMIARKQLVELLRYADLYYKEDYYFSSEKKIQEIINKFMLHATDPVNNKEYAFPQKQFEMLWENNSINDAVFTEYIENPGADKWATPLKDKAGKTQGAAAFLSQNKTLRNPAVFTKWIRLFAGLTIASLLVLSMFSLYEKSSAISSLFKAIGFIVANPTAKVPLTVDITSFGDCPDFPKDSVNIRGCSISLLQQDSILIAGPVTCKKNGKDSAGMFGILNVPYQYVNNEQLIIKAEWQYTRPRIIPSGGIPDEVLIVFTYKKGGKLYTFKSSELPDDLETYTFVGRKDSLLKPGNDKPVVQNDIYRKSVTANLLYFTNRITAKINSCKSDTAGAVIVKYNDPALFSSVSGFIRQLGNFGNRSIALSRELLQDSAVVIFYANSNKPAADSLAMAASRYFNRTYRVVKGIPSIRDTVPGANTNLIELLVYSKPADSARCTTIPSSQLPSGLPDIWKGLTINQYITIDIANNKIWFSRGDKTVFETCIIREVCLSGTGVYRIITETDRRYRVFFIKNVQQQQFVLSACDNAMPSIDMARTMTETMCNNFHRMVVYNNEPVFPVPADVEKTTYFFSYINNVKLQPAELIRFRNQLNNASNQKKRGETISLINTFFTPANNAEALAERQFQDTKERMISFFGPVLDNSYKFRTFDGTPFDRHCLLVGMDASSITLTPVIRFTPKDFKYNCGILENDYWHSTAIKGCHEPLYVNMRLVPGNYTIVWELGLDSLIENQTLVEFSITVPEDKLTLLKERIRTGDSKINGSGFNKIEYSFTVASNQPLNTKIEMTAWWVDVKLKSITLRTLPK